MSDGVRLLKVTGNHLQTIFLVLNWLQQGLNLVDLITESLTLVLSILVKLIIEVLLLLLSLLLALLTSLSKDFFKVRVLFSLPKGHLCVDLLDQFAVFGEKLLELFFISVALDARFLEVVELLLEVLESFITDLLAFFFDRLEASFSLLFDLNFDSVSLVVLKFLNLKQFVLIMLIFDILLVRNALDDSTELLLLGFAAS